MESSEDGARLRSLGSDNKRAGFHLSFTIWLMRLPQPEPESD